MKLLDVSTPKYPNTFAKVDDDVFDALSGVKWNAWMQHRGRLYVQRRIGWKENSRLLQLHRVITGAPAGMVVDHIDGDSLNNQRSNLRICTKAENLRNIHARRGRSKFKGVARHANTSKWRAYINVGGKQKHLGFFESETEAARAYDAAAVAAWGEFANCNFKAAA